MLPKEILEKLYKHEPEILKRMQLYQLPKMIEILRKYESAESEFKTLVLIEHLDDKFLLSEIANSPEADDAVLLATVRNYKLDTVSLREIAKKSNNQEILLTIVRRTHALPDEIVDAATIQVIADKSINPEIFAAILKHYSTSIDLCRVLFKKFLKDCQPFIEDDSFVDLLKKENIMFLLKHQEFLNVLGTDICPLRVFSALDQDKLGVIKLLIDDGLLNLSNENDDRRLTLAQAIEINTTAMDMVSFDSYFEAADSLRAGEIKPADFVMMFRNNVGSESTMSAALDEQAKKGADKLEDIYNSDKSLSRLEKDIEDIRIYFDIIAKNDASNNFKQIVVLSENSPDPSTVEAGTIVMQVKQGLLKAWWMGYHGYELEFKQYNGYFKLDAVPEEIIKQIKSVDFASEGKNIITDEDFIEKIKVICQISKKNHIAAARDGFEKLINIFDKQKQEFIFRNVVVNVWRAVHDKDKLFGSIDDALWVFTQGLCEIARAHNGDEGRFEADDESFPNKINGFACEPGTMHKFFEKLNHIHKSFTVDIAAIDELRSMARQKFINTAIARINNYLVDRIEQINTQQDLTILENLIATIQENAHYANINNSEIKKATILQDKIDFAAVGDVVTTQDHDVQTELRIIQDFTKEIADSIFEEYGETAYAGNKLGVEFASDFALSGDGWMLILDTVLDLGEVLDSLEDKKKKLLATKSMY